MVVIDLQLSMQSVPITPNVVSSNPTQHRQGVLDTTLCDKICQLCKLQKGYTRLAAASDKVYQLLAKSQWFSPGTPVSSTKIKLPATL